jgi:agmatinase
MKVRIPSKRGPFRRAVEEELIAVDRSIQVGLRGPLYGPEDSALPETLGLAKITGPQMHRLETAQVLEGIGRRVGKGALYLSFDIDFMDPTYAPSTGTPEVGGATPVQALELLRGLAGLDFVAYDLVEVMPSYDVGSTTALLAANLAYEMMSLEAVKRRGAGTV